ncbi:hypothetical protein RGQ29_001417 [Quercus rubra]|uniref:Coiled-coil SMC6 And NSE5 INteracting (CANIN) domain-containing protein n=1 Tax=Quercus rubra TaxID=3512 RepID=A0AAN7JED2_QUERU|nr:hypothetical protein RGQ29_001417 [Quercus rubra]KAK4607556.1 hypothetical protein RGQ29_001417 [Quercus rubra]KAK4607557.1 hypothetical protein RGQ29_001417 [Quercus rubra]KAK4607558.1 hypothetical protein RGQ29_001417 [Quercus rubra]
MMDMDDPLDFEFEDQLISSSLVTKKRKKVIGLDDLLSDYYKEKSKVVEKEYKQVKNQKNYNSDEDVNTKEESLTKVINQCEHQMTEISGEEEMATWGIRVFGNQKVPPPLDFPELQSCALLQSFMKNELNSLLELTSENGNTFLEGLLANGWLYKLVSTCGHVQKSIATWTFNLMLYSSKEELRTSACDFWCSVLSSKNETLLIEWSPSYFELKGALEIYGFQFKLSSNIESSHANSNCGGPPQNIRTWIKFAAACCCVRNKQSIFSASEAEELIEVIIFLFLDRQLHGLVMLLYECMQSVISYFTDNEWKTSCNKIAKSLACRVSRDLNCLRAVECISGVNTRSKQLRSAVSYQILLVCFDNKACDEEEILRLLISINVKEKGCDLFKMYIYLVLTENWLLVNQMLENNEEINAMWGLYLRNCSYQIASTDLRTYASKVRNKASYLLQGTINK